MSGTESFKNIKPKNNRPNPIKNSPVSFIRGLREKISGSATPIIGRAIEEILNLNPKIEIIQNVVVVPRFAPRIIPIAPNSVNRPAFTKLTIITVDAEELCTRQVTENPVVNPENRFPVIACIIPLEPLPRKPLQRFRHNLHAEQKHPQASQNLQNRKQNFHVC